MTGVKRRVLPVPGPARASCKLLCEATTTVNNSPFMNCWEGFVTLFSLPKWLAALPHKNGNPDDPIPQKLLRTTTRVYPDLDRTFCPILCFTFSCSGVGF